MSQSQSENTLLMYVNDVLALERDIKEVVALQIESAVDLQNPEATAFLHELSLSTATRHANLVELSHSLGSGAGVVKEVVAAAAGFLAGLYGKVRKHAVSRILRDDYTALSLACTAYSMLYTTGVALRSEPTATLALHHLRAVTPLLMKLSHIIPGVVVAELKVDFPELNQDAAKAGREATASAWSQHGESE
jgi:hypothetical protein